MRYVYSVVRFVPNPARGEFVNVGAIVGSEDASEWEVRQIENPIRARAVDAQGSLEAAWTFLDDVGREIDDFSDKQFSLLEPKVELSEAWLHDLCARHRNIVQLSAPAPVIADSADEALEKVFEQFVLDPTQRRYAFKKKNVALAAVRAAYRDHHLSPGRDIRERVLLQTHSYRERLDFAVTNGNVVQLAQTWSFQVPDQESLAEQIKAWGWTILDLKKVGGTVATSSAEFDVLADVDVRVVYVPPAPEHPAPALSAALDVFNELDVHHAEVQGADAVGESAHRLLQEAGAVLDLKREEPGD